ncbi:MCE family protein [Jatrophihabitans sp.]|uniref:MCE family protein n=1 Tax=Jatrophihabitans sp. TaxID=1932789 RepID=UPI0030C73D50|nr:transporter substrate-binding protein [Jatrophihabitans sp.]
MRRNVVLAQLVVFAVISALIVGYTVFGLLGVNLTSKPFNVTVQLRTGGGIFSGAEVAFRGVEVGRVTSTDLHTGGVTLTLSIHHGTKIPDDAIAHIYDLSAAGEQYVDLVPAKATDTAYLHSGSVIGAERTTTPLQTATVLYDLEQFVDSIHPADIQVLAKEGAAAFSGTGPELHSLIQDSTQLVNQLSSSRSAAVDLLDHATTLVAGAAEHSAQFDSFATSLKELSHTLATVTPTAQKFIEEGEATTKLINALITANGSALGVLLGNAAGLSQIQVARVPGLKALLVAVPQFGKLAPTIVHDGALVGAANVNLNQQLCPTGLPLSNPLSGKRSPLIQASCNQPILPRGAANAPGATGTTTQSAGSTQVGTYDTSTGLATASDGTVVRLGVNGGQQELFGDDAWQALLYAGAGN